jgi:hypothetical protein
MVELPGHAMEFPVLKRIYKLKADAINVLDEVLR